VLQLASGSYEWLIVTSTAGVRAIKAHLDHLCETSNIPPSLVGDLRVAAVGSATASACRDLLDMTPDVVPDTYTAENLAAALGDLRGQSVLLAQADLARPVLAELLAAAGAQLTAVVAYRTVIGSGGADVPAMLAADTIDAITFTSGSTVRNFVQRIGAEHLDSARQTVIACIGTVTAAAAEQAGLTPTVIADPFTVEGLIAALIAYKETAT
jgi:uroporphyrinogen-III synthase